MTKVSNQPPTQQQINADRAKAQTKAENLKGNPLLQMRTAEAAFDTTFNAVPVTQDLPNETPAPTVQVSLEEQFQIFSALTPLIGARPAGDAAEPFGLSTESPLPNPPETSELAAAFQNARGKQLPQALVRIATALASRQLGNLKARIAQTPPPGSIKISPQVIAQIKQQVIGPMLKQLKQSLEAPATTSGDDTAANQNAPAVTKGKDSGAPPPGTVIQPNYGLLAKVTTQVGQSPSASGTFGAGMDIDQLVEYVIMECANNSEMDLRQVAADMQVQINQSSALRKVAEQQETDADNAKALVDNEYSQLVAEKAIDPSKCTQTAYENQRGLIISQPSVDPTTDPPTVSWTPPLGANGSSVQLAEPNPVNPSDLPAWMLFSTPATPSQAFGIPDNVYDALKSLWMAQGSPGGDFNTWLTTPPGPCLTTPVTNVADAQKNLAAASTFALGAAAPQGSAGTDPSAAVSTAATTLVTDLSDAIPNLPGVSPGQEFGIPDNVLTDLQAVYQGLAQPPNQPPCGGNFLAWLTTSTAQGGLGLTMPITSLADAQQNLSTVSAFASSTANPAGSGGFATGGLKASADTLVNDLSNAQPNVALSETAGTGTPFTDSQGNQVTTGLNALQPWQDSTKNALQTQSDLTQQMQLKIQMAQQQYSQCMQVVSNILKSDSDTKDAIIKNLSI